MQLNTLNQLRFKAGAEHLEVDYFFTADAIDGQFPGAVHAWLVVSIESNEPQRFHLLKPIAILKQPKEIIEIIVQRDCVQHLHSLVKNYPA